MSQDAEPKLFTEAEVQALIAAATAPLLAKIEALELRIAKMQRDSSTSSKPPSSDITKPPQGGSGGGGSGKKLKSGGQPGHQKHERQWFKPEEIDQSWSYTAGDESGLEPIAEGDPNEDAWRVVQQIEWTGRSLKIVEHRARRYRSRCSKQVRRAITLEPSEVCAGGAAVAPTR